MHSAGETTVVESADGTPIAYERLGTGPGVVLVQGAMGTVRTFRDLSTCLATQMTVYVAERRGRGASGPPGARYGVDREVEDLAAILAATGSQRVFGLSSGAMITLHAARTLRGSRGSPCTSRPTPPTRAGRGGCSAASSRSSRRGGPPLPWRSACRAGRWGRR